MQAEFDLRWPRGKQWSNEEWQERCEQKAEIGYLASRIARLRRDVLHMTTKQIVERYRALTIHKPRIKDNTQTPRGDAREWGATVATVSGLNRNTLSYAPAMAAQILEYKAKEIGIPCEIIEDRTPNIAVGEKLVAAGKSIRKAKRAMKEIDNERNRQGTRRPGRSDRGGDGTRYRGDEPQG